MIYIHNETKLILNKYKSNSLKNQLIARFYKSSSFQPSEGLRSPKNTRHMRGDEPAKIEECGETEKDGHLNTMVIPSYLLGNHLPRCSSP